MPLATIGLAGAAVSGTAAIKNTTELLVADIYEHLAKKTKSHLDLSKASTGAAKLIAHIHKIKRVKTMAQFDKPVDLYSFYCQSHVIYNEKRTFVGTLDDLPFKGSAVIQGIAGQGKSIFLRYLCCQAIYIGNTVPVFVELRRASAKEPIWKLAIAFLKPMGVNLNEQLFTDLLNNNKITLFLDGYDEIDERHKEAVTSEIEYLSTFGEHTRILITSRPDTGIEFCSALHVAKLSPLYPGEYIEIVNKLAKDTKLSKALVASVDAHPGNISGLLNTPLMVSMLVITYKAFQRLPDNLAEFYDLVFEVLLQRHDGMKFGFNRGRKALLNDTLFRQVFEELCFETMKEHSSGLLTRSLLNKCVSKVLSRHDKKDEVDNYINDVTSVTCLILKDGTEFRYVHKSVQEYYAAAHVKNRSDDNAKVFYLKFAQFRSPHLNPWRQVLRFLAEIDTVRYSVYYQIPRCTAAFLLAGVNPMQPFTVTPETISALIGNVDLAIGFSPDEQPALLYLDKPILNIESYWPIFSINFSTLHLDELIRSGARVEKDDHIAFEWRKVNPNRTLLCLSINNLVQHNMLLPELTRACNWILNDMLAVYNLAIKIIDREDKFEMTDF